MLRYLLKFKFDFKSHFHFKSFSMLAKVVPASWNFEDCLQHNLINRIAGQKNAEIYRGSKYTILAEGPGGLIGNDQVSVSSSKSARRAWPSRILVLIEA